MPQYHAKLRSDGGFFRALRELNREMKNNKVRKKFEAHRFYIPKTERNRTLYKNKIFWTYFKRVLDNTRILNIWRNRGF